MLPVHLKMSRGSRRQPPEGVTTVGLGPTTCVVHVLHDSRSIAHALMIVYVECLVLTNTQFQGVNYVYDCAQRPEPLHTKYFECMDWLTLG